MIHDPAEGLTVQLRHRFEEGKTVYNATVTRGTRKLYVTTDQPSFEAAFAQADRFIEGLRTMQGKLEV